MPNQRADHSGFTVWGSWLNDLVDTNAIFQVDLWSDVPASPGNIPFSHPGNPFAARCFSRRRPSAPRCCVTDRLYASNLQENFFNPNVSARR